ncbi:MFS transporter [Agarivorans sp. QJM3NY_33]|uniref:MFS transporter n=1 Tax=Agarivorans sp. QJM3NY_33 TaxID=3421432 RepID=UPI003D7D542D
MIIQTIIIKINKLMLYRCLLIALGLNQTLLLALLPNIAALKGLQGSEQGLGLIAAVVNVNLISFWLGSGLWGKWLPKLGIRFCSRITISGFILANLLFYFALLIPTTPSLPVMALARLALGLFSSAFIILAQTHLAITKQNGLGQLAKTSGAITLGRLLGPSLVLLPFSMQYLLLIPLILVLPLLIKQLCEKAENQVDFAKDFPLQTYSGKSPREQAKTRRRPNQLKLILLSALLMTALVSTLQFYLLPLLLDLGYQGEQASSLYASILLYISITLLISQLLLIPWWSKQQRPLAPILLLCLALGCLLLSLSVGLSSSGAQQPWLILLAGLTSLTLAVSGFPVWYSQLALSQSSSLSERSRRSGSLSRAHSSGYLVGSAVSSSCLYFSIPLLTPIWVFALGLVACVLCLQQYLRPATQVI